jgi:hypothetical protein
MKWLIVLAAWGVASALFGAGIWLGAVWTQRRHEEETEWARLTSPHRRAR